MDELKKIKEKAQTRVDGATEELYRDNRQTYLNIINLTIDSTTSLCVEIKALNVSRYDEELDGRSVSVKNQVDNIVGTIEMYHASYSTDRKSDEPMALELELDELTELKELASKLSDAKDELSSLKK